MRPGRGVQCEPELDGWLWGKEGDPRRLKCAESSPCFSHSSPLVRIFFFFLSVFVFFLFPFRPNKRVLRQHTRFIWLHVTVNHSASKLQKLLALIFLHLGVQSCLIYILFICRNIVFCIIVIIEPLVFIFQKKSDVLAGIRKLVWKLIIVLIV